MNYARSVLNGTSNYNFIKKKKTKRSKGDKRTLNGWPDYVPFLWNEASQSIYFFKNGVYVDVSQRYKDGKFVKMVLAIVKVQGCIPTITMIDRFHRHCIKAETEAIEEARKLYPTSTVYCDCKDAVRRSNDAILIDRKFNILAHRAAREHENSLSEEQYRRTG